MSIRECLCCGMKVAAILPLFPELLHGSAKQFCPKCDANLFTQTDGSCLTVDIAHHHETVQEALSKLDDALLKACLGFYADLRLVVGGGLIKTEVLGQLHFYQSAKRMLSFSEEGYNSGAIIISIRDDANV